MKEIIYMDTNIINSMLAQLDEGLINNFTLESSSQETNGETTQSTRNSNGQLNADIKVSTGILPGGSLKFGARKGSGGTESELYTTSILEGQKDILNKAFHDHTLEILIRKLNEKNLLAEGNTEYKEGDLFFYESTFKFYDFDLLKNSLNVEAMKKMYYIDIEHSDLNYQDAKKLLNKRNPTAAEREKIKEATLVVATVESFKPVELMYGQLHTVGKYASELLSGMALIKAGKNIGLISKDSLRESSQALTFRIENSRQAKMLFRVIGKKNSVIDENTIIPELAENDLDKVPNMMMDVILGSFKIIQAGDYMVTPLAIYYE